MKNLWIMFVTLLVLSWGIQKSGAEDVFPEFTTTTTTVYLPFSLIQGYEPDPAHEEGLNVKYTLENSQLFTDRDEGHIQTLAEGFSGTTDRSTPWKTLTELVAAYQTQNPDAVRALFTAESQSDIDDMLADPELKQRYLSFMQSIQSVDILVGFNYKNGFLALIEVRHEGMLAEEKITPTPLFFVNVGGTYLVSAAAFEPTDVMDSNITLFLQQDHTVQDLLNPPLPEYTLTIEKAGTGSGAVYGSDDFDLDCGEACIKVYQLGSVLALQAEPDDDSVFVKWQVDGQDVQEKIEMLKDLTVTAIFDQRTP